MLVKEVSNLENEYDTLMYGGISITQAGSVFNKPVPASTFASVRPDTVCTEEGVWCDTALWRAARSATAGCLGARSACRRDPACWVEPRRAVAPMPSQQAC